MTSRSTSQTQGLPFGEYANMEDFLDDFIPKIRHWSEDLYEKEYYTGDFPWKEISEEADPDESILHFFKEPQEYLYSINGSLTKGVWKALESNKLILEKHSLNTSQNDLYDLMYLNNEFMILRKPGDQRLFGKNRYLVLGRERVVKGMDWKQAMTHLSRNHKKGSPTLIIFAIVVLIALFLYFSWR